MECLVFRWLDFLIYERGKYNIPFYYIKSNKRAPIFHRYFTTLAHTHSNMNCYNGTWIMDYGVLYYIMVIN